MSATKSNAIPDAISEETIDNNETDERDFSVHEVVSQFCVLPNSNQDEHSYA